MDAPGVIYQDIGDLLSERNTDTSGVVCLHELEVLLGVSIGVIGY
jgi:hypothetical protein